MLAGTHLISAQACHVCSLSTAHTLRRRQHVTVSAVSRNQAGEAAGTVVSTVSHEATVGQSSGVEQQKSHSLVMQTASEVQIASISGVDDSHAQDQRFHEAYAKAYTMSQLYVANRPSAIPLTEYDTRRKKRDKEEILQVGL